MNPEDELDQLIDAALAGYSSTEPAPGLEARVLRRIHAKAPALWRVWQFRFPAAISAVAALLLAFVAVRMWRQDAAPPPRFGVLRHTIMAPSPPATSSRKVRGVRRHRALPKELPKNEQFPAPAPLTPEERALLAWARRAPAQAQEAFAAFRAQTEAPLTIAPIEIPPIQDENAR